MGCKCGIAKKGKFSPKSRKFPDEQVRIVAGYEPQHRPWMVYFQIAQNGNPANFGVCGGSIINKRYGSSVRLGKSSQIKEMTILNSP